MKCSFFIIAISFLCNIKIVAQELNVKSFVVKTNDITARTQPKPQINNGQKGDAVFTIIPSNATLLTDGQVTDSNNGLHTLSLLYELYHYTVMLSES